MLNTVQQNIDTRDLIAYDNILDFILSGLHTSVHTRIAFLLLDIHGEVCWNCSNQKDVAGIHELTLDEFQDKFVLMKHGVCPRCKHSMLDMIKTNMWTAPHTVCLTLGMRTSKQLLQCYDILYREHQLLVLEKDKQRVDPSQYYEMDASLTCSCLAEGSLGLEFSSLITELRNNSQWFSAYFEIMDHHRIQHGDLYSKTPYRVSYHNNATTILESPDHIPQLRGKTRSVAVVPEAAWQMSKKTYEFIDMVPVFECLKNSLLTMRSAFNKAVKEYGHAPVPHVLTVTSPRDTKDITSVLEESSWFDRSIYFVRLPTWEVDNTQNRETLLTGSKQDLRDYACIPT